MADVRGAGSAALALAVTGLLLLGCGAGGSRKTGGAEDVEAESTADETASTAGDDVAVEGLLGGIPEHKVQRVMQSNEDAILECYSDALDDYDLLQGDLEMAVVVDFDGSVYEAYLRNGTLGSLAAESCILGQIRRFRFPKPGGGRAEVSHSISLYPPYDPPQMLDWSGATADEVVGEQAADLERCLGGRSGVQLTLYVESGGRVASAGATSDTAEMYEAATCLAEAAAAWVFPEPGARRTAKATISF